MKNAFILKIYLQPGAKNNEIVGFYEDHLKSRIQAPAIENKANESLIKFLAEAFAVPKSQVVILKGKMSRKKQIQVISPRKIPEILRDK